MFRKLGYTELLGRLLAAINDADGCPDNQPNRTPDPTSRNDLHGLHGHVLAGLGHTEADVTRGRRADSAERIYALAGYDLTPRARTLAQVSDEYDRNGQNWAACLDAGLAFAALRREEPEDRHLGDLTVIATVAYLAHQHGPDTRTASVHLGDRPRLYDQDTPVSWSASPSTSGASARPTWATWTDSGPPRSCPASVGSPRPAPSPC
ncbi:hypothetical protein [Sciscionella marina]|uniref:hypothetical protein n=1 Tax=Sciscionella marina TaxID=508770 RepID=UPI0003802207|nr:hypothetical protein [Sciscionella marina]